MMILLVPNGDERDTAIHIKTALDRHGHRATLFVAEKSEDMSPAREKRALDRFSKDIEQHDILLVLNGRLPRDRLTTFALGCSVIASLRGKQVVCWGDLPAAQSSELAAFPIIAIRGDFDALEKLP